MSGDRSDLCSGLGGGGSLIFYISCKCPTIQVTVVVKTVNPSLVKIHGDLGEDEADKLKLKGSVSLQ